MDVGLLPSIRWRQRRGFDGVLAVVYQVETLFGIERKSRVGRYKRNTLGYGVRDDDMVGRVVVILILIYLQPGIGLEVLLFQRKYLDKTVRLNVIDHFFGRFPEVQKIAFLPKQDYQFTYRLSTYAESVVRVLKNCSHNRC